MQSKWTPDDVEVLKRIYPHLEISREDILKVFPGRSWDSISDKATKLSLHRTVKSKINMEHLIKLEKVYKI